MSSWHEFFCLRMDI